MATTYYKNANRFPVSIPVFSDGSLTINPGEYVIGASEDVFGRAAALGILTGEGTSEPGEVTAKPSLVVFTEPLGVLGTPGEELLIDPTSTGVTITQGVSGIKFVVTASGYSGYSGISGYSSISGYSGTSGYSGRSGYSGYSG
jgi:hypothetical protein